jgi:hypothetical protein
MMVGRFSFFVRVLLAFYTSLAAAKAAQEPLVQQGYRVGEKIPVSCLNRTMYACNYLNGRSLFVLTRTLATPANILPTLQASCRTSHSRPAMKPAALWNSSLA